MCLFGFGQDRFVSFDTAVFRVSPTNQISAVSLPLEPQSLSESSGSTFPSASPDGSNIAFIHNYDLWLYDTTSEKSARATHIGRPYTETLASVETLISAWSADSKQLLIAVEPGETECVDCEDRGDWTARRYDYGYFIYDVAARMLRKTNLPKGFEVAALLEDGRVIGFLPSGISRPIRIVSPAGKVKAAPGSLQASQLDVSRDGSSAVAEALQGVEASYIVKIDLITGESTRLTPVGAFTEYQFPKLSPDMQHAAWIKGTVKIMMDGSSIFSCSDASVRFQWLDEERMAVYCAQEVFVIEARTGRQLAKAAALNLR